MQSTFSAELQERLLVVQDMLEQSLSRNLTITNHRPLMPQEAGQLQSFQIYQASIQKTPLYQDHFLVSFEQPRYLIKAL